MEHFNRIITSLSHTPSRAIGNEYLNMLAVLFELRQNCHVFDSSFPLIIPLGIVPNSTVSPCFGLHGNLFSAWFGRLFAAF